MYTKEISKRLEKEYRRLEDKVKASNPAADLGVLREAFDCASEAHGAQLRKDGSPYVTHPLAAAEIIVDMGLDLESVVAALLHDVLEDTDVTYQSIAKRFGKAVAEIVDGVTKLTRVQYTSKEDEQMENLRKMFLAMAKDIRVILIKIADRLHNMRTIAYQNEQKRREKALETMEIYAPLAHRLGMQRIKWELEDLALQCLDPVGYEEITKELSDRDRHHRHFLDHVEGRIREAVEEYGIKASIDGRIKHVYSVYRKMMGQHKAIYEIYDRYAVRVIVDDVVDCYNVLGIVHDIYKPMPGRFKDYISTPKPNMYRSLHTTVIGREGMPFEVQIRTWDMHHTAEYGIAAHWKYKQGLEGELGLEEKLAWVRRLLESQQDTDADEFIRTLKIDMFADEVFVFTPKGDVINLPAGATPIDFAYAIHSAVGNRMTGVKVNGKLSTYDYLLQNGDIIDVMTSKTAHGPSRDWLDLAKTSEARNKIRQWFKKEKREENIAEGRALFEQCLRKLGASPQEATEEDALPHVLKRLSFGSLDELYAAIGYGGISAMRAANRAIDELKRLGKISKGKKLPDIVKKPPKKPVHSDSGVIVEGVENCLVKFSRCCTPVPGDEIVGFITKGYGVSIHRADCANVSALAGAHSGGRWIGVSWADVVKSSYDTSVEVSAKDRDNIAMDVMMAMSAQKAGVTSFVSRSLGDGYHIIHIGLRVDGLEALSDVISKLRRVPGVIQVTRRGLA